MLVTSKSSGEEFELIFIDGNTIRHGKDIYTYSYSGTDRYNYSVSITYPNGFRVWWNQDDGSGTSGNNVLKYFMSNEPVPSISSYLNDRFLIDAIQFNKNAKETSVSNSDKITVFIIIIVVLIIIGTAIFRPEKLPEVLDALSELDIGDD